MSAPLVPLPPAVTENRRRLLEVQYALGDLSIEVLRLQKILSGIEEWFRPCRADSHVFIGDRCVKCGEPLNAYQVSSRAACAAGLHQRGPGDKCIECGETLPTR